MQTSAASLTPAPAIAGSSVLVTGGASGLGRALVDRFVEEGAGVTVLDRSEEGLAELTRRHGERVAVVTGDVTSAAANEQAVSTAVERFGRLDTFVANAGLWDFGRPLADLTLDQVDAGFDELFAVNVKASLLGVRAGLDELRRTQGSVLLTLSNAAFYPMGGGPLYTASKHAGVGLVRQLAFELAPQVRVNGIAPGGMATSLSGPHALGLANQTIGAMPIAEYLAEHSALQISPEPTDYTAGYLMLASRRHARITTGTVLDISSVGTPQRPGG
ncbi:3-(cis-5,6-dihydroxycyclohexa-1,3-dien-1-yl)propanoate dehydrogenase [Nocardioides sp. QY071]|uniref:3-(cis-5,6-dihydroxycyclohexa-1, 3-dien-1-yl)propanoate dehydrogenase n=1 Tax=Nocardioides sp. QY071 TaxID=3044187 RepID=UPI00249A3494|nr:3-(cis-5,6-dihydroxycyclohexa-1,3-dien-1-yl)propanoate dehydrogenase [Nocardioides sp. QY071]WGY00412.1 3-(cis-5,6-dihydroxycyclohexa-1,3-dien-1-yl)propanoate dehydrogenase [Nocardioides sp. QY071]